MSTFPADEARGRRLSGSCPPLLAIQFRGHSVELAPQQAVLIRDAFATAEGAAERRLLVLLDAKTTELLAAPDHAGTVTLRIDRDEEAALLDVTRRWVRAGHLLLESPGLVRLWAELDGQIDSRLDEWATDASVLALVT